jgi:hypothetical protein
MCVAEFADLVGLSTGLKEVEALLGVDLGKLTDVKELLKEAAILGHVETTRMLLEKMSKVKDGRMSPGRDI